MEKCWITQKLPIFVKLYETNYLRAKFARKSPRNIIVFVYYFTTFLSPYTATKETNPALRHAQSKIKKAINEQTATPCHLIYRGALINIISEHLKLLKDSCGEEQALRNGSPS